MLEVLLKAVDLVLAVVGGATEVDLEVCSVLVLVLEEAMEAGLFFVTDGATEVETVGDSVPAVFSKHLHALLIRFALRLANSLGTGSVDDERYFGQNAAAREEKRSSARRALSS